MYNNRDWPGMNGEWQQIDWTRFERMLDDLLSEIVPGARGKSISKVGKFIRDVMDMTAPNRQTDGQRGTAAADNRPARTERRSPEKTAERVLYKVDVTETAKLVKVTIRIPPHIDPRKLQLLVNGSVLRIEGPLGNRQTVQLPAPVLKTGSAAFRNGLLIVRLRKRSGAGYREIYIQFP